MEQYDPRAYWSKVGEEVQKRAGSYVAGDDNPFLRYKREKFLTKFLSAIDFRDQVVLELGPGPGGNLKYIAEHGHPKRLLGADISETMRDLATQNLSDFRDIVELHHINGRDLPFDDQSVDVSYTVTVLHHVTEEAMFLSLVKELCRVTKRDVVIMEDIGSAQQAGGQGSWVGRSTDVYKSAFAKHSFELSDVQFLGTKVSRLYYLPVFRVYRRLLKPRHHEGDRIGPVMKLAIGGPLRVTRYIDDVIPDNRDLAKMVFRRITPR
jgi:ubiquinone/menaquinone biosynthesis C-methylase UbiE